MKNFSELLATNLALDCVVTLQPLNQRGSGCELTLGHFRVAPPALTQITRIRFSVPVLTTIDFELKGAVELLSLTIDGYEMFPYHVHYKDNHWSVTLERPFYQWLHQATGQGWLLVPAVPDRVSSTDLSVTQ